MPSVFEYKKKSIISSLFIINRNQKGELQTKNNTDIYLPLPLLFNLCRFELLSNDLSFQPEGSLQAIFLLKGD